MAELRWDREERDWGHLLHGRVGRILAFLIEVSDGRVVLRPKLPGPYGSRLSEFGHPNEHAAMNRAAHILNEFGQDWNAEQPVEAQAFAVLAAGADQDPLAALRRDHPGHVIDVLDENGHHWWVATLAKALTPEMHAAGVRRTVRRSSPESLHLALSEQNALLSGWRP